MADAVEQQDLGVGEGAREDRGAGVVPAKLATSAASAALELQHARRAARRTRRMLDEWLHGFEGTLTM